ncbi:hypothetical protein D3C78_1282000 [compost metagenome]
MDKRPRDAVGRHAEVYFLPIFIQAQPIEVIGHKVDVFFGKQRRAGETADTFRAVRQQVAMPGPQIKERVKTLVFIKIVVEHVVWRAAAIDDVFIGSCPQDVLIRRVRRAA